MYDQPLHVVRGSGTTLYTADGSEYLDCVNNVAHVGHCHPKVTLRFWLRRFQPLCMLALQTTVGTD